MLSIYNAKFKFGIVFVMCSLSFSFSSKKLVPWLRLIFRCHLLLELYYQSWSYVNKTGIDMRVPLTYLQKFCAFMVVFSILCFECVSLSISSA